MPFDSEGVFSRLHNWENDRINDIDIASDRHDEEDDNFADGLSSCLLKNGLVAMQGNLNMGDFQIKNVANGISSNDAINKAQLDSSVSNTSSAIKTILNQMIKIGDIKASLQSANHDNWLLCDGQAVSRETYAQLFTLIGTNFGSGDGTTTFNLPDYRGKFLRGLGGDSAADIYTTQAEGLPDHTHNVSYDYSTLDGGQWSIPSVVTYSSSANQATSSLASVSNSIYGASNHVTPINQAVNFFIKAKMEE